ncbi:MAG: alpha/beta hydrolase [Bacillota bacterium]
MYLSIDGLRTQYEVRGEGEPVLLLHGWGAGIDAMRPIADAVAALNMQAVSFDFPGFGGSDAPEEAWGVPEYARFTRRFIEEMGLVGADVICHSFGGRVTIYLASEDQTLFRRLVLVDAAGIRPKRSLKWYIRTYAYKLGKLLKNYRWIDRLFHISERQKNAGSAEYRSLGSGLMRSTFVKVVNLDLSDRLPLIKNSTLLIWGANDVDTPLYMGQIMEKRIPDAGLVVFEGAGHFSYADQYARFCSVLKAFFRP